MLSKYADRITGLLIPETLFSLCITTINQMVIEVTIVITLTMRAPMMTHGTGWIPAILSASIAHTMPINNNGCSRLLHSTMIIMMVVMEGELSTISLFCLFVSFFLCVFLFFNHKIILFWKITCHLGKFSFCT